MVKRNNTAKAAAKAKKGIEDRPPIELGNVTVPTADLLSSGFTPLDVCISGRTRGGYGKGLIILLVGDSEAGKTFLAYTTLGEAAQNENFDRHRFIVDKPEGGAMMDIVRYFGKSAAARIEPPQGTVDDWQNSTTIEDLYYNLDDALDKGPCVYIVDSMDALDAVDDQEKFEEKKKASREGKEAKGSYGVAKAKASSQGLRRVVQKIRKTGSVLIMIAQAKETIGFGFNPKTRAGGKSLKFYSDVELWLSVLKTLKKPVKGKDRPVGSLIGVKVEKNRLSGWKGTVEMPFYRSVGIDNVGGMVHYLSDVEGHWKKSNGVVRATELGVSMKAEQLVKHIEDKNLEGKVKKVCRSVWRAVEQQCGVSRKPRYT